MSSNAAAKLVTSFEKLIAGEAVDLYGEGISDFFEYIAGKLFHSVRDRGIWFDGVVGLTAKMRKKAQIDFEGRMWVALGKDQWQERLKARITDKRGSKQGIWIALRIGDDKAEGSLHDLI